MLKKVKSYIDNPLNYAKVNINDSKKEYVVQPLSIPENLVQLQTRNDFYRALFISKDDDFKLHQEKKPNSCFLNKHLNDGFNTGQAYCIGTLNLLSISKKQ